MLSLGHTNTLAHTCPLSLRNASQEDANEPLQRILVHRVHISHVGHTEEQDLCVDRHGDVLTTGLVNVLLCLLSHLHLGLMEDNNTGLQTCC